MVMQLMLNIFECEVFLQVVPNMKQTKIILLF